MVTMHESDVEGEEKQWRSGSSNSRCCFGRSAFTKSQSISIEDFQALEDIVSFDHTIRARTTIVRADSMALICRETVAASISDGKGLLWKMHKKFCRERSHQNQKHQLAEIIRTTKALAKHLVDEVVRGQNAGLIVHIPPPTLTTQQRLEGNQ